MARLTWRMPRADFSIRPLGSTSTLISTRVRRGAISWKVATPWCVMPSVTFHWMRSSGRCSSISAVNSREKSQIFVLNLRCVSSSWLTLWTRCMNLGHSSNCVKWL